jgi:hypothetical protein
MQDAEWRQAVPRENVRRVCHERSTASVPGSCPWISKFLCEPTSAQRVDFPVKELTAMLMLTGKIAGRLIKVEDHADWRAVELLACVVVGGPTVRFDVFENVAFMNCVFLYDGMEVEGREWLAFMSMERMTAPVKEQRRGQA